MSDIIGTKKTESAKSHDVICNNCTHFHREKHDSISCDAFDNIPKEILLGTVDHSEPVKWQKNKIVFELKK
jgi:hypothetical protein